MLTTCDDCRGQVSTKAPACPHCGCEQMPPRLTDFDMRFESMVKLFVKAAFAAIPAAIIVTVTCGFFWFLLLGAFLDKVMPN